MSLASGRTLLGVWASLALAGALACNERTAILAGAGGRMGTGGGAATTGGGGGPPGTGGSAGAGGASAGVNGSAGAGGQVTDGGRDDASAPSCPSAAPAPAPLRRLTHFEYNNTVRDLFMDATRPADRLPTDAFTSVAAETSVSALLVEGYHTLAHDFAVAATKDAASVVGLLGCDPATAGEPACRQKLIGELVPRIFRRAPASQDASELGDVFTMGAELGGGFAGGVRAVLEVALQSPEFLYRVEFGEPIGSAAPGIGRPTPYEMATRLAYLLWGSTPDAQLLAAAAAGELASKAQIAAQARRLLADPRARDVVRTFTFQLMGLPGADYGGNLTASNPGFTAEIAALIEEETRLFIDEVTWQGAGNFQALLTSPVSFLNGPLATFYGVPGVSGAAFRRVELDPARRAGLLTQPSVLARSSHGTWTSPTLRGVRVLQQVLCTDIPLPPPDVVVTPPPPPPPPTLTGRERLEQATEAAACNACHKITDGVGLGFEHYDAVGRWRDTEEGRAVDASGELVGTDVPGTFDGAIELAARLARSQDARGCYVGKWMTFAYGRREGPEDACSRRLLMDDFARTDGSVRELLVALTQTEAFLTRPLPPPMAAQP